jgi:sterol desaturase/sphingolipid hydroxylase (fatty acid hydroxylase superfamily)
MPAKRRLRRSTLIVLTMVALIVVAHVFLWRSDMATGEKAMWTALNTVAWTIILAPVFLVDRWLDSIRARDRQTPSEDPAGHRARRR